MKYISHLIGKKTSQYFLLVFAFIAIVQLFSPVKAAAAIVENRGGIPSQFTTDPGGIENIATCNPFRYSSYIWVSKATDPTQRTIDIATGQTGEFMALNFLGAACNNGIINSKITNPDKDYARTNIVSIKASDTNGVVYPIQGISAGDFIDVDYNYAGGCYSSPNCRYFKTSRNGNPFAKAFLLSGFGSFIPGKYYDIELKATIREIVQQNATDRNQKKCVVNNSSGGVIIANSMNDPRCPTKDVIYPIRIYVKPPPDNPPVGTASTECSNLKLSGLSDSNYSPAGGNGYDLFYDMGPAKEGFITRGKASGGSATVDMPSLGLQLNDTIRVRITNYDYQGNVDDTKSVMINGLRYSPGSSCPNFQINATPTVTLKDDSGNQDTENPTKADFASLFKVSSTYGGPIKVNNVTLSCTYTINKQVSGWPKVGTGSSPPAVTVSSVTQTNCGDNDVDLSSARLVAGDQVCITATANPGSGRVDPSGTLLFTAPVTIYRHDPVCAKIVNKPYVSFYGSDIRADDSCSALSAKGIDTNRKAIGGSSTEFAAFALGAIKGISYSTAFAESNPLGPGYFGGYPPPCNSVAIPTTPATQPSPPRASIAIPLGITVYNGDVSFSVSTINNTEKAYVYVKGNVNINGNIGFSDSGWSSRTDIPSLYIYATGDIKIDPSVTNIFGVYNAGGNFNTCAGVDFAENLVNSLVFGSCNSQLVITGAVTAKKVNLQRTFGSLRDASLGTCPGQIVANNCSAEVFDLNPMFYFADAPSISSTPGTADKTYDFITSLPPFL